MRYERAPLGPGRSIAAFSRVVVFYAFSALYIPLVILRTWLGSDTSSYYPMARFWCAAGRAIFGIRVRAEGAEHLAPHEDYVVVANHRSLFDIFAIVAAFGARQTRWVAKKELGRVPIFGSALRATGQILIDRQDHSQAVEALHAHVGDRGTSIVFFGEGHRAPGVELLPFKKGGAAFAIDAGLPLVPIAISGSQLLLPSDSILPVPGEIRVVVGDPIDVAGMGPDDREALTERVRETIRRTLDRLEGREEAAPA